MKRKGMKTTAEIEAEKEPELIEIIKKAWIKPTRFVYNELDPAFEAKVLRCEWPKEHIIKMTKLTDCPIEDIVNDIIMVQKWDKNYYIALDFQDFASPEFTYLLKNEDLIILKKT